MVSHFSDKCVFEFSILISSVSMWPVGQLSRSPRQGTDAHQYFCHSMVQSVYDTWVSCGSASRQLTVGYWIFSRWCLQSEGNREAVVMTAGGELWVPEHFPWLKRKLWRSGYPTCECPGKSQGYSTRETLVSQGEFQEQVIKCRMTPIFIGGRQGWESWPVSASLEHLQPDCKNNLNIPKIMTSYVFY